MRIPRLTIATLAAAVAALGTLASAGCATSSHPTAPSELGVPRSFADMEAVIEVPGPVTVETVTSARWQVTRAGLINLDDPKAKAAGLTDGDEPIVVDFHALKHPDHGLFIVDTGAEKALKDDREHAALQGIITTFLKPETFHVEKDLKTYLDGAGQPLRGVFLTHLHIDHVMGLPDVPNAATIYAGPGETTTTSLQNLVMQGNIDRELLGKSALREWQFGKSTGGKSTGGKSTGGKSTDGKPAVIDIFGDGSLWAIHVPGHTPGSTAYLARTPSGPVLFTGDACHTAWGWQNRVEPGTFSDDKAASKASLNALFALVDAHPSIDVRLGHQHLHDVSGGLSAAGGASRN